MLRFMLRVRIRVRASVRVKIKVRVSSSILPYCLYAGPHFTRVQLQAIEPIRNPLPSVSVVPIVPVFRLALERTCCPRTDSGIPPR